MKFPSFGKKDAQPIVPAPKGAPKAAVLASKPPAFPDGKKQIFTGLVFIFVSFLGAVFLLYLTVNAQSAKEVEVKDLNEKLLLVSTEKQAATSQKEELQQQVGRVLDLEKVVRASEKVHGESEADRKEGSLWINRKSGNAMVTLGVLNGVTKGVRLGVFEADKRVGTVKVTSALDVVSYVEPVDKKLTEFSRDYYQVKPD